MSRKILIVDADPTAAQSTKAVVARAIPGAELAIQPSPERAWLYALQHHPDMLIIDPLPNSMASARLISLLTQQGTPQILVLSHTPAPAMRSLMAQLGVVAEAYLAKTAPPDDLIARLHSLCLASTVG
jgi:DNA-binding NarL/FixJ family response regulator